jgi:molecular chaperone GrpE (heat shock protein)
LQLGEDGSLLNLQIPPPTETEETTEESSSSYESGPEEEGEEPEGQEEEGPQDLSQQVQEQTVNSAQEFFGDSLGRLKDQLQDERAQFESLAEQVPDEEAQAQIQEMVDAYESLESTLDQSAEDLGLTEDVNQALQQAQQAAGGQQEEEA